MSLDTFAPLLSPSSATDKPEFKILQADFGDGYSQAATQLNSVRRSITLKWDVLTASQAAPIVAFMVAHTGTIPFSYRIPGEDTATVWTCADIEQGYAAANLKSITATLRQSFNIITP